MTRFRVSAAVADKLAAKHAVTLAEVAEVFEDDGLRTFRGREGLYEAYGRTAAGRYLLVIFKPEDNAYRLVTAREMTHAERRRFRRK